MNRIIHYFQSTPLRNLLYASILIICFALILWFFSWSLLFHISLIRSLRVTEDVSSPASLLQLPSPVLDKLGITLSSSTPSLAPSFLPVSTTTVTATSSSLISLLPTKLSLTLLNGTSIKGLASVWQDKLMKAGFSRATTGNADRRDYAGVHIRFRPQASQSINVLTQEFIKRGVLPNAVISEPAPETQQEDVVVILGK